MATANHLQQWRIALMGALFEKNIDGPKIFEQADGLSRPIK